MRQISGLVLFTLMLLSFAFTSEAASNESKNYQAARKLFEQYVYLEKAFDPAVADLYADDAKIQNTRTYPNGTKRTLTIPSLQYKDLIRKSMPLAKARADTNEYKDVKLIEEGKNIRITATRFSNLKNYDSPISILVGSTKEGQWKILEEISESKP